MPSATRLHRPLEFDAPRFSEWLRSARLAEGWSTRDLARRAGISQAYVVSLERHRTTDVAAGPVPTVNVVAALAGALGADPVETLRRCLRPAPRHALLVLDAPTAPPVELVRTITGPTADAWVAGGPTASPAGSPAASTTHDIRLHRRLSDRYEPEVIATLLDRELARVAPSIQGKQIGLVFAETSTVMSHVSNPQELIDFESRWKDVVVDSTRKVGAHAAWNVCVYDATTLRGLPDGRATLEFLLHHHDEHWFARGSAVQTGDEARALILDAVA